MHCLIFCFFLFLFNVKFGGPERGVHVLSTPGHRDSFWGQEAKLMFCVCKFHSHGDYHKFPFRLIHVTQATVALLKEDRNTEYEYSEAPE